MGLTMADVRLKTVGNRDLAYQTLHAALAVYVNAYGKGGRDFPRLRMARALLKQLDYLIKARQWRERGD